MWAVLLRCYMMYVMLSPFLLHEIGSRSMLLIEVLKWTGRRTCYAVRRWLSYSLAYISKHCKVSEIEIFFVLSRRSNKWKTKCVISMTVYVLLRSRASRRGGITLYFPLSPISRNTFAIESACRRCGKSRWILLCLTIKISSTQRNDVLSFSARRKMYR